MNNLTNKEIAKVFAMYLGCQCTEPYSGKPIGVLNSVHAHGHIGVLHKTLWDNLDADKVKLFLTPLQSISDEDAIEVAKMWGNVFVDLSTDMEEKISFGKHTINTGQWISRWEFREYLISRGYDCPLWFGIDHWANGKTAIELGIAISK